MSGYTIDPKKPNHINAIITHNPTVSITKINGREVKENLTCADLPKILAARKEDFFIEIMSGDSESSHGIFPLLAKDKLQNCVVGASEQDKTAAAAHTTAVKEYFIELANKGFCESFTPTPDLNGLTEQQALLILSNLASDDKITGAMMFPQYGKIIFQHKGQDSDNFIFDYSGRTDECFRKMGMLRLHIDEGFYFDDYGRKRDIDVVDMLKQRFQEWKASDYQGRLVPASLSGFKYDEPAAAQSNTASLGNLSFLAPAASPAPAAAGIIQLPRPI